MDEIICYCHNYMAKDLEKDAFEHGKSLVMEIDLCRVKGW